MGTSVSFHGIGNNILKYVTAFAVSGSLALSAMPAHADSVPQGRIVTARLGSSPLIIWDASSLIHELPVNGNERQSLDRKLAADALAIIRYRLSSFGQAHEVTVRIVYAAVADDNQQYGAPTFTGENPILFVTAKMPQSVQMLTEWQQSLNHGVMPAGLRVSEKI